VPVLLEQDEGHLVNTASIAGLIPAAMDIYSVTKHAVVAISEAVQLQLAARQAKVGVSVLCPGWVRTRIDDAERNRPSKYSGEGPADVPAEGVAARRALVASGTPPSFVAASVLDAIRADRFYVLPHPEWMALVHSRVENIERGDPPRMVEIGTIREPVDAAKAVH
jgi:short-subunit dehydrogenase